MSKMVVYLYLLIPLLFLSVDSSSIRGRNNKNELVPLMNSRVETQEKTNSLKTVNNEPLMIEIPVPREDELKETKDMDKKTKRPSKKRVSKIKPLRKKHRRRRDVSIPRSRSLRDQKSNPLVVQHSGNVTERPLKNATKNAVSRGEMLKALSNHSKRKERRQGEDYLKDDRNNTLRAKHQSSRNLHKHRLPHADQSPLIKMVYPSTPKPDRRSTKYTHKDLMADRKRLEQKINYIKNMLNVNDSSLDDSVRIRRRSESDRTANKIAKMFLTLSAVNGLHDRRRSKCSDDDEDDEDRVQDVWEKERRNSPSRKSSSSNEERYKVKKWIEFMKNKRSSGKICPCMENFHGEESDAFPLEQKLPKGYFLLEKSRSSEESSEYRDPYYSSRDKPLGHSKRLFNKGSEQDKSKEQAKNGKKKLELPLTDLELYRSRAKQILQNAEEILDRIKEEEERRLASPNILMNQLKELTSRIHGDPRNNENDLIRKIQKNLGWSPLSKSKEGEHEENTFVDNVKSYILDPYEKAKALTDESTKMLSSYLLRNLGKIQDSEEQEAKEAEGATDELNVFYGQVPQKEDEKPLPASLAQEHPPRDPLSKNKEELQHWEDTLSSILHRPEDTAQEEIDLAKKQETIKNRMEDIIKEQQKKLNDFETNHKSEEVSRETDFEDGSTQEMIKSAQPEDTVGESKKLDSSSEDSHIEKPQEENQEKVEKIHPKGIEKSAEVGEPLLESRDKDLVEKSEVRQDEGLLQKEKDIPDAVKTYEDEELGEEIFDEIVKTINESSDEQAKDPRVGEHQQIVDGKETSREKVTGENIETPQNENKATPEKITGEKSPEEYDDVVSAPRYLTDDNSLYPEKENNKPAGDEDETLQAALEDDYGGLPRSEGETLLKELEELETELEREEEEMDQGNNQAQDNLRQGSDPIQEVEDNVEMSKTDPTRNLQDNEQDSKIKLTETEDRKPLEHADLVKEASQGSSEADYSRKPDSKHEDELKSDETGEDNLQLEQQENIKSVQKNSEEGDETVSKTAQNEEGVKNAEDEIVEKLKSVSENQEDQETGGSSASDEVLEKERNSQSDENTGDQKSSEKETEEDVPLQATFSEDEQKESSENLSNETLLTEDKEHKSKEIEMEEPSLKAENPTEKTDNEPFLKTTNEDGETISRDTSSDEQILNSDETLKETLSDQLEENDLNAEDVGETAPKVASLEEEDQVQEARNFNEGDEETPLEKTLNESQINNEDGNDAEIQNSKEADDILLKENLNEDKEILESNPEEAIQENKNEDEGDNNETSGEVAMTKSSQGEGDDALPKASDSEEDFIQPTDNIEDDSESNLRSENPDLETSKEMPLTSISDIQSQEDKEEGGQQGEETLLKSNLDELVQSNEDTNNSEVLKEVFENPKDEETLLKEASPEDKQENENSQSLNPEETLQSTLNEENLSKNTDDETPRGAQLDDDEQEIDQTPKSVQLDEDEQGIDETPLRATLNAQEEENNDGTNDGETSAKATTNEQPVKKLENIGSEETLEEGILGNQVEENIEGTNDETYLKEANLKESLENQENGHESPVGAVFDNLEDDNENQRSNDQEFDENSNEIDDPSLRASLADFNMEKSDEIDDKTQKSAESEEIEQLADPEKVQETLLRSDSLENEFDKIDDETPLKSTNDQDWGREETSRSEDLTDDLNNQIDDNEDETPLKSMRFDNTNIESAEPSDEDSSETVRQENPLGENLIAGDDSREENHSRFSSFPDVLQMPDPTSETLKAGKLKVPKSIGQIMRNLDGKDKGDITSIQNLNPEKIDHIIDKIDEAEQQNLEQPEVDCRKECACADEIDTRSRNIGRYEIVKDFLHWMKDLKINRVLTED